MYFKGKVWESGLDLSGWESDPVVNSQEESHEHFYSSEWLLDTQLGLFPKDIIFETWYPYRDCRWSKRLITAISKQPD